MTTRDMVLAALTSVIWGLGFVAIKLGLESFSAPQLTAMRFLIASIPVLLVPRPPLSWWSTALIGLTLFTGQFLLLFFAYAHGMPPGLASVSQQTQAFFTVLLAAVFLGDRPTLRQCAGMTVAFAGLALIGLTGGTDLKLTALGLALAGALSWAVGNVLVKRRANVPVFPIVVWASLVPPLPAIVLGRRDPAPHQGRVERLAAEPRGRRLPGRVRDSPRLRGLGEPAPAILDGRGGAVRAPGAVHRRRVVGAGLPRGLQPAALRGHGAHPWRAGGHRAAGPAPFVMTDHETEPARP
jgi:uncharacterized membrane protein